MARHCDGCAVRACALVAALASPARTIGGIHPISVSWNNHEYAALLVSAKAPITIPSIVE
jgi:hypothetical protein